VRNAGKMRENDSGMLQLLYLVSGHCPAFTLGCRPQTGSRISSPEVVTRMREKAQSAERRAAEVRRHGCPAFCGLDVIERSDRPLADGRQRWRDFWLSSWQAHQKCGYHPQAALDGPPTNSEHAES